MKVYRGLEEFRHPDCPVVTTGTFDGVHLGHRQILQRLRSIAQREQGETVVLTFWPHPRFVLEKDPDLKLLSTLEEKIALLEAEGIDHLVIMPFTKEFSKLSSQEFIQQILVEGLGTRMLVIGYDHKFGRNREGSFENLKANAPAYGFQVEEIPEQDVNETAVSSTRIREALQQGHVNEAIDYLGRPYSLTGKVVDGDKVGRKLGYPTANIEVPEDYKLVPAHGVYAVHVHVNGAVFEGMMNIGIRPTLHDSGQVIKEVNIFDFNEDVYGAALTVDFIHKIRGEEKFDNEEQLKARIKIDKDEALYYLKHFKHDHFS